MEDLLAATTEAQEIIQRVGQECQQECQQQIAYVVTRCLRDVFQERAMEFRLVFERKRNQTEVRGVFVDAEGHEYDPASGCGGGFLDVAAFGLRLACLMLHRPEPAKVLILDEPAKMVSREYIPNLASLMQELTRELGFQIIMVTHIAALAETCDNLIDLENIK